MKEVSKETSDATCAPVTGNRSYFSVDEPKKVFRSARVNAIEERITK